MERYSMYDYKKEKSYLFTDRGQRLFLAIRDQIDEKLRISGAVTMVCAIELPNGIGCEGTWEMMACVDRLVELGELKEIPVLSERTQDKIFVRKR